MTANRFYLRTPLVRRNAVRAIMEAPDGYEVQINPPKRSADQNRLLWARLGDIAEQVVWYGQKLDATDWKDMFTASLRHARVVPGIDRGTFVPLGMRTSTMNKQEFSDLLELISAFAAEHGVAFSEESEAA